MKKKTILFTTMLMISIGVVHAQKAYTYVQQNGTALTALGTAAFDVTGSPEVTFVDGKAVMKIGTNTVAELPMNNGGQLVVEFTTTLADEALNKVSKTVSGAGYATLYSPFQLQVPASGDVEVYAPTYDSGNHVLKCIDDTNVAEEILPVGTGLLLKNAGTVDFAISAGASTAEKGDLSGSSLTIPASSVALALASGNAIYTLGHEKENNDLFGFFKYTGTNLNAGSAYLVAAASSAAKDFVGLSFGDEATAIGNISADRNGDGKFLINGNIVIIKNGRKYNVNGQEVK